METHVPTDLILSQILASLIESHSSRIKGELYAFGLQISLQRLYVADRNQSSDLIAQARAACCARNIDIIRLWTPVNIPSADTVPEDTAMSLPEQERWELSMLIPMAAHASDHSCDHMARFLPRS